MLDIAIIDDDVEALKAIKKILANIKIVDFVEAYESFNDFFTAADSGNHYDVILLDIQFNEQENGIDYASKLFTIFPQLKIVFITGYSDYIAEGYDVEALHYLMKPLKAEKLYDVLERAVNKIKQNEKHLVLNTFDETIRIPLHEIIYIDVDRNYVTIHSNKDYTIKKALAEIEKELDERFFRIGRSAIINLKYICRVTKTDVYLNNGIILQLPRGIYEALNRAIINEM